MQAIILQEKYKDIGFINNYLETTVKLMEVLSKIFNNEVLKDRLVLKGGSAVNFYMGSLKRLFLDVDLDLKNSNEIVNKEKEIISINLFNIMEKLNYEYSNKRSRHSFSLDSFCFPYQKNNGNLDYLKIEINYSCTQHLYPDKLLEDENLIGTNVSVLNLHELMGMKLKALFDRASIKDLFDIFQLINHYSSLNNKDIRKSFLFYYTLASLKYDNSIINKIDYITRKDMISKLYPIIPKKSGYNLDNMKHDVLDFIYDTLNFTDREMDFYRAFQEGIYLPELLFENEQVIEKAKNNSIASYKMSLKNNKC